MDFDSIYKDKKNEKSKKMGGELTSRQVIANIVCRVDAYTKF